MAGELREVDGKLSRMANHIEAFEANTDDRLSNQFRRIENALRHIDQRVVSRVEAALTGTAGPLMAGQALGDQPRQRRGTAPPEPTRPKRCPMCNADVKIMPTTGGGELALCTNCAWTQKVS